jgi:hypothetical protein
MPSPYGKLLHSLVPQVMRSQKRKGDITPILPRKKRKIRRKRNKK